MEEEKIQELLEYLSKIGFRGTQLEVSIRQQLQSEKFEFRVNQELSFDNEKAFFELNFQRDSQFKAYRLANYTAHYQDQHSRKEHVRKFTASPGGICNPNLAFNIVSGRVDDLMEKLSALRVEDFLDIDIYGKIEEFLSTSSDVFGITYFHNEPEGNIEYNIPVIKSGGWYAIDNYSAILTPYPPIKHGIYNGIDSYGLEELMRKINWRDDRQLFILHDDREPEFKPKVADVQEQMYRLSLDPIGGDIADVLQLKYWSDTSFFGDNIQQTAWDYFESLPKREMHFPVNVPVKTSFNLLCGRAAVKNTSYLSREKELWWERLDFTSHADKNHYETKVIKNFGEERLFSILSSMPIPSSQLNRLLLDLEGGDAASLVLPNSRKIYLEANPEQQTVDVYSESLRPIMVNFYFDPDWNPPEKQYSNSEVLKRKTIKNVHRPNKLTADTQQHKRKK